MKSIVAKITSEQSVKLDESWSSFSRSSNPNNEDRIHIGWIYRYNYLRGFGDISDLEDNKLYFFHVTSIGQEFFSFEKKGYNSKQALESLKSQLSFDYRRKYQFESAAHDTISDPYEIGMTCRFGSYKLYVSGNELPQIIEENLSGYPCLIEGQLVCFKINNEKAQEVRSPEFCMYELLRNRNDYSNAIWNLLFHYFPHILYSISFRGFESVDVELNKYRLVIDRILQSVKEFDIQQFNSIDYYDYNISMEGTATAKDYDTYWLEIFCKPKDPYDEYISKVFSVNEDLAPSRYSYGNPSLGSFNIYPKYSSEFWAFYDELRTCNDNYHHLVKKHFGKILQNRITSFVSDYSPQKHFMFLVEKIKNQFINSCEFYEKGDFPVFYTSGDVNLYYDREDKYEINRIEFSFIRTFHYVLTTYTGRYEGYYKGKRSQGSVYVSDAKDGLRRIKNTLDSLNQQLHSYLESIFDNVVEEYLQRLWSASKENVTNAP